MIKTNAAGMKKAAWGKKQVEWLCHHMPWSHSLQCREYSSTFSFKAVLTMQVTRGSVLLADLLLKVDQDALIVLSQSPALGMAASRPLVSINCLVRLLGEGIIQSTPLMKSLKTVLDNNSVHVIVVNKYANGQDSANHTHVLPCGLSIQNSSKINPSLDLYFYFCFP